MLKGSLADTLSVLGGGPPLQDQGFTSTPGHGHGRRSRALTPRPTAARRRAGCGSLPWWTASGCPAVPVGCGSAARRIRCREAASLSRDQDQAGTIKVCCGEVRAESQSEATRPPPGVWDRAGGRDGGPAAESGSVPGLGLGQELVFPALRRPAGALTRSSSASSEIEDQPPPLAALTQLLRSANWCYCFATVSRQPGRAQRPLARRTRTRARLEPRVGWPQSNARAQSNFGSLVS